MIIRPEGNDDHRAIGDLTTAAFAPTPHGSGTEAAIIDALRAAGALTLSLVAVDAGRIVGHAAFSPVTIDGEPGAWYVLGPVSVRTDRQRAGIGQTLIREGLGQLKQRGAAGCVTVGDPDHYARFGFVADPDLTCADAPAPYFQCLAFKPPPPHGKVRFHPAFAIDTVP